MPVQPPPPTATGASEAHVGPGDAQEKKVTTPLAPSQRNALSTLPVNTKPCMSATPVRVPTVNHAAAPGDVGSDPNAPTMPNADGVVA